MVHIDSMGAGLQLVRGRFSNFLLGKVSLEFKLHGMSIFHDIQMPNGHIFWYWLLGDATVTWLGTLVVLHILRDPIQGQGQGHGAFELPTTSEAVHAGGDDRSPLAGLSGYK